MELLEFGVGNIFWTSLAFIIVWVMLGKFAWKPILKSIKERESSIEEALSSSAKAKEEVGNLKKQIDEMKLEARKEREQILAEAKKKSDKMVDEAKEKANAEGERILQSARDSIESEKNAMIQQVKHDAVEITIQIAEKVLLKELDNKKEQEQLIQKMLREVSLN